MSTRWDFDRERKIARDTILKVFAAALAEVDPRRAVRSALTLDARRLSVEGTPVDARHGVHVVAVGKAAVAMTQGALEVLNGLIISGDVITKEGHANDPLPKRFHVYEAGHPIPDARGERATKEALIHLMSLGEGVVVLALISGGGSALLEAPRDGITLHDLAVTTDLLLRAGAPIEDLNAVRAPLSRVKAGGLRTAAPRATWLTLILSDVLGNDPRIIASGPTVPGWSNCDLALQIVDRYRLREELPSPVLRLLEADEGTAAAATSTRDILRIVGDNAAAIGAARRISRELGLETQVSWAAATGEASTLGRDWVALVAEAPGAVDVLIGGGEATVTVRGGGVGGRNTEFALAAALELERRALKDWVIGSLATDGQDALTGLAGAIVDAETCRRAGAEGVDPPTALQQNDSLAAIEAAGDSVRTGPTGTNVNDLYFALRMRPDGDVTPDKGA